MPFFIQEERVFKTALNLNPFVDLTVERPFQLLLHIYIFFLFRVRDVVLRQILKFILGNLSSIKRKRLGLNMDNIMGGDEQILTALKFLHLFIFKSSC